MQQLFIPAVILILSFLSGCGKKDPLSFEVINTTLSDSSCSDCKTTIVYVKNFSDNDKNWGALEQYGMQKHDTSIAVESYFFVHDSSNVSPGPITFKQFDEVYSEFEIGEDAIIEGVSYFRRYPRSGLEGF